MPKIKQAYEKERYSVRVDVKLYLPKRKDEEQGSLKFAFVFAVSSQYSYVDIYLFARAKAREEFGGIKSVIQRYEIESIELSNIS